MIASRQTAAIKLDAERFTAAGQMTNPPKTGKWHLPENQFEAVASKNRKIWKHQGIQIGIIDSQKHPA
ncbi:MAG: hypothetical protein AAFY06_13470 [Pseudomonadota bacterium]